jgi:hypothetical protein
LMVPLRTELSAGATLPAEEPPAGADEEHPATARIVAARAAHAGTACRRCRSGMQATLS